MGFRILIWALGLLAGSAFGQDLDGFIGRADSLATAGDEPALTALVQARPLWIGAVVGQLVEAGLEVGASGDSLAEQANLSFARRLGALHAAGGQSSAPKAEAERALGWGQADKATRMRARGLAAEAEAARRAGEADRAAELLDQAVALHESIGDTRSLAVLHGSLGVVHWARQDWAAVRRHYERALELRRAIDDKILEGRTLNGLGSLELTTGDLHRALAWYEQAIALRRGTGDLAGLGTSLSYAANAERQLGRLLAARELYEEALPVLESIGDGRKCVETLQGIGVLYWQMGRHGDAERTLRHAIARAPESNAVDHLPQLRIDLAKTLRSQGRLREALDSVAAAQQELAAAPDAALGLLADREAGMCYLGLGDRDAARDHFLASVKTAREVGTPDVLGDALVSLATLYLELGAAERARSTAEEALALARESANPHLERDALATLGWAQVRMGDRDAAVRTQEQVLELDLRDGRMAFVPDDELQLGAALVLAGKPEQGREYSRRALARLAADGRADYAWPPLVNLGDSFEDSQPDSAAYWYERAIDRMERDRESFGGGNLSASFLSTDRGTIYEGILHYFGQQGLRGTDERWLKRAFAVAERSRASGLRELIDGATLGADAAASAWLDSIVALADHPTARRRAEAAYMAQLRKRREAQGYRDAPVQPDALRRALPRGSLFLEYAVTDSASYVFVVDRKSTTLHALPPRAALAAQVRAVHDALAKPGSADAELRRTARSLYEALLRPVHAELQRAELVFIAADDVLHELPFELLLEADAGGDLTELPWLGRQHAIGYTPSAALFLQKRAKARGTGVLAIGDPAFSAQPPRGSQRALDPLPYARSELTALAAHFRRDESELLVGAAASKTALRDRLSAHVPRVLHLATHGIVDPRQPNLSCIALASSEADDGYLYAPEILDLPLQVDLVVLSACESGRGRIERGEGVVGLTRSFLAAGARSIICSLWSVSDASTAQLMDRFYAELADGATGPLALREARVSLMAQPATAHPFHWAPFVWIGDLASAKR